VADDIVDVQTRAASPVGRFPVLLKAAASEERDDVAGPGRLPFLVDDVPVSEPEVKLPVGVAGAGLVLRRGRGRRIRLLSALLGNRFLRNGRRRGGRENDRCCKREKPQSTHSSLPSSHRISAWIGPRRSPRLRSSGPSTSASIAGRAPAFCTLRARPWDSSASPAR